MSGRLLDGRYQLQRLVGRGGMAAVWRGVDVRLGRPVAVKVPDEARLTDPTAAERFDREARTVTRLTHPNMVAVYDLGRDGGDAYQVMELIDRGQPRRGDASMALAALWGAEKLRRSCDLALRVPSRSTSVIDLNTFRNRASQLERVHLSNAVAEHASNDAQVPGFG